MDKITAVTISVIAATLSFFLTGYEILSLIVFFCFIFYFFTLPSKLFIITGLLWVIYQVMTKNNNFFYPYIMVISGLLLSLIPNRNKKLNLPLFRIDSPALIIKCAILIIFIAAGFLSFMIYQKQKTGIVKENDKTVEKVIIKLN